MKRLVGFSLLSVCIQVIQVTAVYALENWTEVTTNPVGDRFLVYEEAIQRQIDTVRFWEYRYFEQPNNAFLPFAVDTSVYGVMLYQLGNCASGIVQTQTILVFDQTQQQIQQQDYGDRGEVTQLMPGSSAADVLDYVCDQDERAQ